MKIVIAEKISPAAVQILRSELGWDVLTHDQLGGNLAAHVADADALIVRSAVQASDDLIAHGGKLRVIGRAGVGVDNIDQEAATKRGIVVMNTPGANAVAVAEHTFALMLALARRISQADTTTRNGKWEKKSLQGSELRGKALGIVGLGRIGVEVAKRARAFEMNVLAHDPFVAPAVARDLNIQLASLDELYSAADYISLHLGLTPQTQGMINAASIASMRRGVRIVNCARGELLDEGAVAAALQSGQIGGLAVDVFPVEPPKESPLLALDNVVATPHIAGSTNEAQDAVGVQIAQQVREYLARGVIQNATNVPSVTEQEYAAMRPYITLAGRLGAFLAQSTSGNLEGMVLAYGGHLNEWKTDLVRNAAIAGILNQSGADAANIVNAGTIAKERGIAVHEQRQAQTDDAEGNTITLTLKTTEQSASAKGSVPQGKLRRPRLDELEGIDIEVPLERTLIYLRNIDVPGVVGRVGTILGKHGINIANFSLGRGEPITNRSAEAISVVQVDGEISTAALEDLRKAESVTSVKLVKL